MTDLSIYEGNDKTWTVTVTDSDSVAIDITGYTFLFTVKKKISDSDDNAIISKNITTHSDPTGGITAIIINREDTVDISPKQYPCDFQMIDDDDKRITIFKGTFTIIQSIGDRNI